jgi:putative ATP-binding cassette transporter
MRNLKKTAILFLFSVLFSVLFLHFKSFALENNSNEINQLSAEDSSKIESFIEKQMKKGRIPGMAVVVVRGAETIYQKGFGYSELESKMNVTSETLFEIGSNSKAFTALGVLKLQGDGVVNIKDPITKYIPWLKMNYKGEEVSVTIEELMYHTSGIPFKTIDKIPISNDNDAIEKTIKTLVGVELSSFPGDHFEYATINYDVLGLLIEKVTGTTYEEYVEKFLLEPMGLKNTYLYKDKAINEDIARGYKIKFFNPQAYDAPMYRGNKPAGYYISNAEDMAEWLKIQMNTSEVSTFDKSLIRSSHVPNRRVEPLSDGSSYASGWFIYQKGGGEISHSGSNPNFSSFIVFNPEEKSGIAILSNTNSAYVSLIGQGINEILKCNN